MAFNNQKNPPWQRNAGHQNMANMQTIVSFPQAQPVYNPGLAGLQQQQQQQQAQQQQNLSLLPQISLQQQQSMYSQTVQYPTSRPINAIGFQNQPQPQPQAPQQQQQQQQQQQAHQAQQINQNSPKLNPNNRAFSGTGLVTKLQSDYGIIDDQVFFHTNICVKGIQPKVGDRVLVDAAYNTNMPFKWNASRVQVLPQANVGNSSGSSSSHTSVGGRSSHGPSVPFGGNSGGGGGQSKCGTNDSRGVNVRVNRTGGNASRAKSPGRGSINRSSSRSTKDDYEDGDRRRKREDQDADRIIGHGGGYREKPRTRSPERGRERERERTPVKKPSPKRSRLRSVQSYMVQVPKQLLPIKNVSILELRARYPKLYIPSDFFHAEVGWPKSFPPNAPLQLHTGCHFHIFNKEVDGPLPLAASPQSLLDPPDADYLYTVKVMLMSTPDMMEIYRSCFYRNEKERREESRNYLHPTRLVNFLVGTRGKNEPMAVGGPWSPSLDGLHPDTDPKVLMRTAIRTCRALTGIDLSACPLWYRFVDIYYRRTESYHKGRLVPPRVETVVIFLPRMSACLPSDAEWEKIRLRYQHHLDSIINSSNEEAVADDAGPGEEVKVMVANDAAPSVVPHSNNGGGADDEVAKSTEPAAVVAAATAAAASAAASAATSAAVAAEETAAAAPSSAVEPATIAVAAPAAAADSQEQLEPETETAAAAPVVVEQQEAVVAVEQPKPANDDSTKGSGVGGDNNSDCTNSTGSIMPAPSPSIETVAQTSHEQLLQEFKRKKVAELKAELSNRNLPTDGVKAVLLARLSEAILDEKQAQQSTAAAQQKEAAPEPDSPSTGATETAVAPVDAVEKSDEPPAAEVPPADVKPVTAETDVEMADVSEPVKLEPEDSKVEVTAAPTAAAVAKPETKPPVAVVAPRKKEPAIKLTEKERQNLERWYATPKEPHVLVHPSRTAKSGKFDCTTVSLSVLLDYRPEDTKEHSFEVALFAELFNDMLARDFGFKIYTELALLAKRANEKAAEAKKELSAKQEARGVASADVSNGEDSSKASTTTDKGDSGKKDEKESNDRKRRRRSEDEDQRGTGGKSSEPAEPARFLTVHPDLLLSFVYFDVSQCGYVLEKDLVELVYSLGLDLSRSQIRKMVGDVTVVRHSLYYRQLTDKALESDKPEPPPVAGAKKPEDETAGTEEQSTDNDGAATPNTDPITDHQTLELAQGNTNFVAQLQASVRHIVNGLEKECDASPAAKRPKTAGDGDVSSDELPAASGEFVEYNGTIVDVGKYLEQAKLTEQARERAEKSLELERTLNESLTARTKRSAQHIAELQAELKNAKKKLGDNEQMIRDLTRKTTEYLSILTNVYDRVRPVVYPADRKRSTSTVSSSKRGSSKERTTAAVKDKDTSSAQDAKKTEKASTATDAGGSDAGNEAGSGSTAPQEQQKAGGETMDVVPEEANDAAATKTKDVALVNKAKPTADGTTAADKSDQE